MKRLSLLAFLLLVFAGVHAAPPAKVIESIDLATPFAIKAPWRFLASQGPDVPSDQSNTGDSEPGRIKLCITGDAGRSCPLDLNRAPNADWNDYFGDVHFLEEAKIVRPHGSAAAPLFIVRAAGLHGGNGNQFVITQAVAYDRQRAQFVRIYADSVARNTNDEIRYIETGPLRGAIVSAEPTDDAPFGYWITVNRLTDDYTYKMLPRFRSATRYGDGNPLAVIDSEMPNIQKRLGLWHSGLPLPLPGRRCPKPRLMRMELWCS